MIENGQQQHRHQEFIKFLELIDQQIPEMPWVEIHLVTDNYATHKTPKVQRWLARRPRYHIHFTPSSASWLNQVQRFFAEITEKRIRRGAFRSVKALRTAIVQYRDRHNGKAKPFVWTADGKLVLTLVRSFPRATSSWNIPVGHGRPTECCLRTGLSEDCSTSRNHPEKLIADPHFRLQIVAASGLQASNAKAVGASQFDMLQVSWQGIRWPLHISGPERVES